MEKNAGVKSSDSGPTETCRSSEKTWGGWRWDIPVRVKLICFISIELDEAAQAELDAIQKKLGKYKGKYGKEIGIDELEWVKFK